MYWPIGAPRIYAAPGYKPTAEQIYHSDDGASQTSAITGSEPRQNGSSTTLDSVENEDEGLLPNHLTPGTPKTPAIRQVEQDTNPDIAPPRPSNVSHLSDGLPDVAKLPILDLRVSRTGLLFATITATSLTIWQTKPTSILATVIRSASSLEQYGPNVSLLIRPDSAIFVVQSTLGYLITYSLATDPDALVYRPHFPESASVSVRRQSHFTGTRNHADRIFLGAGEGGGVREVSVRFRMVIKVDAGIERALALEDELVIATRKPPAMQCIRWTPDTTGNQTRTELLSKMTWLGKKTTVVDMIYDRPMNISAWITEDGRAFAVQRVQETQGIQHAEESKVNGSPKKQSTKLFRGYCFHEPAKSSGYATRAAINARFSLIAIARADSTIDVYIAKDYAGNIPLIHKQSLSVSSATSGKVTSLSYSPDGYCLLAGFEHGWATWSVFGKPLSTSFTANPSLAVSNAEVWLTGVSLGAWIGNGSEVLLTAPNDSRIWLLEMARSAVAGCFSAANVSRTILHTKDTIMVYRGYDLPDLTTISAEQSLWHHAKMPPTYLIDQWPIKSTVVSPDGRYVAVAGRRGLAHYSLNSGRWKTFNDPVEQNQFSVRGGMCWYRNVLIAAVEADDVHEVRLFSREADLDNSTMLHVERFPAPIVLIAPSGEDSLLVYTYENLLYHYVLTQEQSRTNFVQVGQIAFHGIIRSPARVRGLSWILPDEQLNEGDPSQDVATATVVFLVDGKLVLLQPSFNEQGQLKYDMRIIAQNVEYFSLMRDSPQVAPYENAGLADSYDSSALRDSLWMFDGQEMKAWTDVQEVLRSSPADSGRDLPPTVSVPVDFYPLSISLDKGILVGVEPELVQRRDVDFSFFRFAIRTHLFIPPILKYHLARYDTTAGLDLAHQYQRLEYFPHALEILLHNVLDEEVDKHPTAEEALLPSVLSFLSSFPSYLDIIVQCTRKTEVRSWRTLFAHLPPPALLFEDALQKGSLKTAGGYLLVLHTFEELASSSEQLITLLRRAKDEGDWELCKELARFLLALDESGNTLREALELVDLRTPNAGRSQSSFMFKGSHLRPSHAGNRGPTGLGIYHVSAEGSDTSSIDSRTPDKASPLQAMRDRPAANGDYFSQGH